MNRPGEKITVCLNALTEFSPCYGSRVYLIELARALAPLHVIELKLLVGRGKTQCLPPDLRLHAVEVPVPVKRSYWQFPFGPFIHWKTKRTAAKVWHLPNSLPILTKPATTVVTIHDLADLRCAKYGKWRTRYRHLVNYLAARRADHVLTVSSNSKQDIVELLKIPPDRVSVVYPGVDQRFRALKRSHSPALEKYGIRTEFVLAPGGLAPNKNLPGLLRAFAELSKRGLRHTLVCTGHATQREHQELDGLIADLGLNGQVLIPGHVREEDMPALYNASAAVAYLSLYEGFGLPILEAMACGVPVVASDRSSIPEAAGDAAILVDPEDSHAVASALHRVITDAQLRQELVSAGVERARQFTWNETALKTLAVYIHAMNQKHAPEAPKLGAALSR
jgi:glycosyltransferase involved in cell wall biosynthesis